MDNTEARAAFEVWMESEGCIAEIMGRDEQGYLYESASYRWEGWLAAWTAARRPDAGLQVTEEAVMAFRFALRERGLNILMDRPIREGLTAALPHLRPDAGRDHDKDAGKLVQLMGPY